MLNICIGTAGSGKTTFFKDKINKLCNIDHKKIIFIVPEQFSFETERDLYSALGAEKSLNAEVLSFTRLANRVFREYGGIAGTYLDNTGKAVLMSEALYQVQGKLDIYAKQAQSPYFVKAMLQTVTELKYAGLSNKQTEILVDNLSVGLLKSKLSEIALIYSVYESYLGNSYLDSDDDLTRAAEKIANNNFFEGYTVFVDGFKGFTYQELKILKLMILQSDDCYFSFSCERITENENSLDLFASVTKVCKRFIDYAKQNAVKVAPPILLEKSYRYHNNELIHLEKNIFRSDYETYEDDITNIQVYKALNRYEEVQYVAASICKLVREENYRYKDIAVICRNLENYKTIVEKQFKDYKIPVFLDNRHPITSKPLVRLIFSALNIVSGSFAAEEIFRMLKTGLCGVTAEDISNFENYCYVWGVNGSAFLKEFKNHPRGFVADKTEQDEEILVTVNATREKIINPLLVLKEKFKQNQYGFDKTKALFEFLEDLDVAGNIVLLLDSDPDNKEMLADYADIWQETMAVLDQAALSLKQVAIDPKRYNKLLSLMFDMHEMGKIPQSIDDVTFGVADRIRVNEPKAVFIIGACEDEFPLKQSDFGMFSKQERMVLNSIGAEISLSGEEQWLEERLCAYDALTCMAEKLFVSYPESDLSGKSFSPSVIIKDLKRIFPKIITCDRTKLDKLYFAENDVSVFDTYTKAYHSDLELKASIEQAMQEDNMFAVKSANIKKALGVRELKLNNKDIAEKLFGTNMTISPSKLEQFYMCKFKYFVNYGLKIRPIKKAELSPIETGSIFHYVLEAMVKRHGGKALCTIEKKQLEEEIDQLLTEYLQSVLQGDEDKTERFKYLYMRLKSNLVKLIIQLSKEFSQSEFEPCDFELPISKKEGVSPICVEVSGKGKIYIEGRVDRVDVYHQGDTKYIRVVDYKSGSKSFKLNDVYYGLNLQMLIYLFTIWQNGSGRYGNILPAGILYMPAQGKVNTINRDASDEEMEQTTMQTYRMNGLIIDDVDVVTAMEKDVSGVFIPAKLKRDGTFDSTSSVASLSELGNIKNYIEKLICDMGELLLDGEISAKPTVGSFNPCSYCEYSSVCLIEPQDEIVKMENKSKSELHDLFKGEQ